MCSKYYILNYIKQYQICAFCETWGVSEEQFENFVDNYTSFSSIRKRLRKVGRFSGGVTVFVQNDLIELGSISRIFDNFTDCVCLHLKGDYYGLENDIILLFTYLSPEGSSIYENVDGNTNGVELFEDEILSTVVSNYPDANIFLAGDFNSRTSNLSDSISNDNTDFIFDDNSVYFPDEFELMRNSKDQSENNFGLALIKLCKTYGIHIMNGRLHNDMDGDFTCVTHNGESVVDYFIASSNRFQYCTEFDIGDMYQSIHFPVTCKFTFNIADNNDMRNARDTGINLLKFKWKDDKKEEFLINFTQQFDIMKDAILNSINRSCKDSIKMIVELYQTAARSMQVRTHNFSNVRETNPWGDTQCENVKREKLHALYRSRAYPSPDNLKEYKYHRNRLKISLRKRSIHIQKAKNESF